MHGERKRNIVSLKDTNEFLISQFLILKLQVISSNHRDEYSARGGSNSKATFSFLRSPLTVTSGIRLFCYSTIAHYRASRLSLQNDMLDEATFSAKDEIAIGRSVVNIQILFAPTIRTLLMLTIFRKFDAVGVSPAKQAALILAHKEE